MSQQIITGSVFTKNDFLWFCPVRPTDYDKKTPGLKRVYIPVFCQMPIFVIEEYTVYKNEKRK